MNCSSQRRDAGQAAIESALILPLMVFMVLGLIQLTMAQQAKLMTEYAAYQAARAGSVWNGNNERMHDAAMVALLPTMHRTDSIAELAKAYAWATAYDVAMQQLPWGSTAPKTITGAYLHGLVRVDTVSPAGFPQLNNNWRLRNSNNWQELDFDGPDSYPEVPNIEPRLAKFFNLPTPDATEQNYRRSTVLSVRLRYWYEMRVPFANSVIFLAWFASNADVAIYGAIERGSTQRGNMLMVNGNANAVAAQGKGIKVKKGYDSLEPNEMLVLWSLATGSIPLVSNAIGKKYFLPLTASYSMRMQSNFYQKWNMHKNPNYAP